MSAQRRRPTLEQVAARAGVSRATASRVVNQHPSVDPALAARVSQAIDELGYVPDQAARALMTGRVDSVALIAAEPPDRVFGDPFFAAIVRGASQELGRAGVHLVLTMCQSEADLTRVETFLRGGHVDGVLMISEHGELEVLTRVLATGTTVVLGGRPVVSVPGLSYVDHDNRRGGALAAARLLESGRTRVATITGPQDMSAGVDRLEGFREGLGAHFDADLVEEGDFTVEGGARATARLLARHPEVDGVFAASDAMALGVLRELHAAGHRVPEDVALVGFDDSEVARGVTPALTTVRQRTVDQGALMAQLLLLQLGRPVAVPHPALADGVGDVVVLGVELVARDSG